MKISNVEIDGKQIHIFNSAAYIVESSTGYTLEFDMVVSEVVANKYRDVTSLIAKIELEDGRLIESFMYLKSLSGGLPQLNLFLELNGVDEYSGFPVFTENDLEFPDIEAGITLEDIRKYEMPNERITLKLNLPIAQTEWLNQQKGKELAEIFKEAIYDYWNKHNIG